MDELWMASLVGLWIMVIAMAFLLAGALRQLGLIALRLGDDPGALVTEAGLDRGTILPDVGVFDSDFGEPRRLSDFLGPRQRLIVFVAPTCLSCRHLVPHLNEVIATREREFDFVTICRGDLESCRGFKHMNQLRAPMLVDTTGEVESRFDVRFTPFAYLADANNRVLLRGVVNNWRQIESLLDQEGALQSGEFGVVGEPSGDLKGERIGAG
jgi:methylamine dehydrogenase accessory protein MauD